MSILQQQNEGCAKEYVFCEVGGKLLNIVYTNIITQSVLITLTLVRLRCTRQWLLQLLSPATHAHFRL